MNGSDSTADGSAMELTARILFSDGTALPAALCVPPSGGDHAPLTALSALLNDPAVESISMRLNGGVSANFPVTRLDLIEVEWRHCGDPVPDAQGRPRMTAALMLSNWQLLIGHLGVSANGDPRQALAVAFANGERFLRIDGRSRVLFVQKTSVLWLEPMLYDAAQGRMGLELMPAHPLCRGLDPTPV